MDCPACGAPMEAYVLGAREAAICGRCGRVGIEADHRGTEENGESWDEALDRFYERRVGTASGRSTLPPAPASVDGRDDGREGNATVDDGGDPVDDEKAVDDGDGGRAADEGENATPDQGPGSADGGGGVTTEEGETDADEAGDDESGPDRDEGAQSVGGE